MAKFMVLALPRSRTAWMAEWLGFDGRFAVGHDLAVECSALQDFEDAIDSVDGSVETGAMLGWRLLRAWYPEMRLGVVHRNVGHVLASLAKLGLGQAYAPDMLARAEMLWALSSEPGVESLTFEALDDERAAARLWEHLLRIDWDYEWWKDCCARNIQIDMAARLRRLAANAPGLERLKLEIIYEVGQLGGEGCRLN